VYDLFMAIGDDIPLHTASRYYLNRQRGEVRTLGIASAMRWVAFMHELRRYDLPSDPPGCKGVRPCKSTVVIPVGRPCLTCGIAFAAPRKTKCCSLSCAALHGCATKKQDTIVNTIEGL
jgi:hypothetical protein